MGWLSNMADDAAEELTFNKINNFEGDLIKAGKVTKMYAERIDLGGFRSLTLSIIGPFNENTEKGCTVVFTCQYTTIKLASDEYKIETDYSRKFGLGLLQFDVDYTDELDQILDDENLQVEVLINNLLIRI